MPSILKLCLLAILMAYAGQVVGQNFYVIAARGTVKSKKTGKNLRSGDIIPAEDILTFRDLSDQLSLISEEGQRYVVKYPGKRFKSKKSAFPLEAVRQQGPAGMFPIDPAFRTVEDAKKFFSERSFVFLGQDTRIKMPKKLFPMSRALFFYMNYDFKEDNIDKKIDYKGDTLVMIKRNLFKIDGKEVDGKYAENFKFYYYNQPKNKHTFIGKMMPYFPVDERLKEETDVVVARMQQRNASPDAVVRELAGFMLQQYGNTVSADFSQWVADTYPDLVPGIQIAQSQAAAEAARIQAVADSAAAASPQLPSAGSGKGVSGTPR